MREQIKESSSRITSIHGLRGVAIILVLGYHFDLPLFERGYWGVDLFFWISGYLITGGFLREYGLKREVNRKFGWIDIRYYLIKRARRILPLATIVLIATTSIIYIFGNIVDSLWKSGWTIRSLQKLSHWRKKKDYVTHPYWT